MAVAAPARREAPARVPRDRPAPGRKPRVLKAAPAARPAPARNAAPARKASPARKAAPARRSPAARQAAPARKPSPARRAPVRRSAPARRPGGQLIPIAVGTATAVRHLPDSGLVVRMTRGRLWIGVLGVLLAGIVGLNVVTLSLAAGSGHIEQNIEALEQENSILRARESQKSGIARLRQEAAGLGLVMPTADQVSTVQAGRGDLAIAVRRLAAAGTAP